MTKTKKRNLFLSLATGVFAAIAALILWAFPNQTVKADTVDYSTYSEVSTGYVAMNDFIVVFDNTLVGDFNSRNLQYTGDGVDPNLHGFFMVAGIYNISDSSDNNFVYEASNIADLSLFYDDEVPEEAVGAHYTAEQITIGTTTVNAEDLKIPVEGYDASGIRFFAPTVSEEPTEPENPGDPTEPTDPTEPENPGDPTEPTDPTEPENPGTDIEGQGENAEESHSATDEAAETVAVEEPAAETESKSKICEWFTNAWEDASEFVTDNLEIVITGAIAFVLLVSLIIVSIKRR